MAFVVSLLSIYIAWINPVKDLSSNLIATLGVLCTVLIGWQIFSFIDFRSYEKRMKELESRLLENEDRMLDAQKHILANLKYIESTHKRIESLYNSLDSSHDTRSRAFGGVYHSIALLYKTLRELNQHTPEFFLAQEVLFHLVDFDMSLTSSTDVLMKILDETKECLSQGLFIPINQKAILNKQIDFVLKNFEESDKSSIPELRHSLNEIASLIQTIPE